MDEQTTVIPKKTTRIRKTTAQSTSAIEASSSVPMPAVLSDGVTQVFDDLINNLIKNRQEFDSSQKEIAQVKQDWIREQRQHELELSQPQFALKKQQKAPSV